MRYESCFGMLPLVGASVQHQLIQYPRVSHVASWISCTVLILSSFSHYLLYLPFFFYFIYSGATSPNSAFCYIFPLISISATVRPFTLHPRPEVCARPARLLQGRNMGLQVGGAQPARHDSRTQGKDNAAGKGLGMPVLGACLAASCRIFYSVCGCDALLLCPCLLLVPAWRRALPLASCHHLRTAWLPLWLWPCLHLPHAAECSRDPSCCFPVALFPILRLSFFLFLLFLPFWQ